MTAFELKVEGCEIDTYSFRHAQLHGYEKLALVNFYPVSDDGIECGIFALYKKTDTEVVIGEISISAKSAAYYASIEQVELYYPKVAEFLIANELPLPDILCGQLEYETGEMLRQYTVPVVKF